MNFWDSSAIVPLCVNEPATPAARSILAKDPYTVVWWATRTECLSALARQTREGGITTAGERQARQVLETIAKSWTEIQPTDRLRATAERLLAVHPLRPADAFQLAAALLCGAVDRRAACPSCALTTVYESPLTKKDLICFLSNERQPVWFQSKPDDRVRNGFRTILIDPK